MAASPSAVSSANTDGGNALAALLAAAAASMHRQQQQSNATRSTDELFRGLSAASTATTTAPPKPKPLVATISNKNKNNNAGSSVSSKRNKANFDRQPNGGPTNNDHDIQNELEAKRDTLCQLLNLKPTSLIDSQPPVNRSPAKAPPTSSLSGNTPLNGKNDFSSSSSSHKGSTSSSPSSIHHLLNSSKTSSDNRNNHNNQFHQLQQQQQQQLVDGLDKLERPHAKHENSHGCGVGRQQQQQHHHNHQYLQNGVSKAQKHSGNASSSGCKESLASIIGHSKQRQSNNIKLFNSHINNNINNSAAISTGTNTTKIRTKTDHKSSTSSSSSISTSTTDKDSTDAAKLLMSLVNGNPKPVISNASSASVVASTSANNGVESPDHVELRNLETWFDEDEEPMDDSCYQELVDPSNSNGWNAEDMFKYNERMHKITSSYNEKTLSGNYTIPLLKPKINNQSKLSSRLATQLAKEIEARVVAEGRITPESSDDDELFEAERAQRVKLKQQKQLDQLKKLEPQWPQDYQHHSPSAHRLQLNNVSVGKTSNTKSSSQCSISTETPATVSLSSSPTLNNIVIKPVTSSSRNILRTCLI